MIYVSSKLRHRQLWLDSSLPISSSWIHGEELPPSECSAMWDRYRDEISRSAALLLYLEHGDLLKGAMLEMGMAFENHLPIVIVWSGPVEMLASVIGTIVYHASVTIVRTMEDAERLLLSILDGKTPPSTTTQSSL